ncbi:MAG TPA: hypothetical protein VN958_05925 [Chitinophagaceae bacterium]|nr:hypothetical protein [Chitinophagaceae bacterium]
MVQNERRFADNTKVVHTKGTKPPPQDNKSGWQLITFGKGTDMNTNASQFDPTKHTGTINLPNLMKIINLSFLGPKLGNSPNSAKDIKPADLVNEITKEVGESKDSRIFDKDGNQVYNSDPAPVIKILPRRDPTFTKLSDGSGAGWKDRDTFKFSYPAIYPNDPDTIEVIPYGNPQKMIPPKNKLPKKN